VEWFEIKGLGNLRTYSVVNFGPSGFENDTPYVLGIVEFESGIKVLGRLSKDISDNDIRLGMGLKVVPVKQGERISYEFQKAS
jgi:uncharacterized OB-fold protein